MVYGVLVVFLSTIFRNRREKIYKIMILSVRWLGKIERGRRVLISIILKGLLLEGKSMSLLKFFCCCLGVYLKLCFRSKLI
jgi:hypothetical protein